MTFWHCKCINLIITTAAKELASAKATLAVLRAEMDRLARQMPEYETVRAMYGVGERTAPQLKAEIGDVRRFSHLSSIVSFAGVDLAVDESGKHISKSNPTAKRGSPHLRKTLYQIVRTYLLKAPVDKPVYQFLDKKRAEDKPYFVYQEQDQQKVAAYQERIKNIPPEKIAYVDECGMDTCLYREYGYAAHGQQVFGRVSGRKYQRCGIVAAKMANKIFAPLQYSGTMDSGLFDSWLSNQLLPSLDKGTVIV